MSAEGSSDAPEPSAVAAVSSWFNFDVSGLASAATDLTKQAQGLVEGLHTTMVEKAVEAEADMRREQEIVRAERAKNKVCASLLFCRRLIDSHTHHNTTPCINVLQKMLEGSSDLPWETTDESTAILSQDLMEQVMSLSLCDENFTSAPESATLTALEFDFESFVPVIMRLLALDSNLAAVHAKLSPHMDEMLLWRNYYLRVQYLRARIGMDGKAAKEGLGSESQEKIICRFKGVVQKKKKKKAATSSSGSSGGDEETEVVFTEAVDAATKEKEEAAEKERMRKREQAALAAEVEAELLAGGGNMDDMDLDNLDLGDLELDDEDLEDLSDLDESGMGGNSLLDAEIARELNEEFGDADADGDAVDDADADADLREIEDEES